MSLEFFLGRQLRTPASSYISSVPVKRSGPIFRTGSVRDHLLPPWAKPPGSPASRRAHCCNFFTSLPASPLVLCCQDSVQKHKCELRKRQSVPLSLLQTLHGFHSDPSEALKSSHSPFAPTFLSVLGSASLPCSAWSCVSCSWTG